MKYKLLLLSLFSFIYFNVSAQVQKEQGRIIKKDNQELTGFVSYFFDSPTEIFYWDAQNEKHVFSPDQISEIRLISGQRFVSKPFKSASGTHDQIFQAILITDKINFYVREGNNKEFYVEKDGIIYKLENNVKLIKEKGKELKSYDYQYVSVLSQLLQDRMDLVGNLNQIKLQEKDLLKILTEYANGDINYYYTPNTKELEHNNFWSVYTQVSNHGGMNSNVETEGFSFGYQVGVQYHFGKGTRSSVKLAFNKSTYSFSDLNVEALSLVAKYQYEFLKKSTYTSYLVAQVLEFTKTDINYKADWKEDHESGGISIGIRPGIGIEARPSDKVSFFLEINDLLYMGSIPKNFSVGLNYRLGKTAEEHLSL
ncbi:hypothetical protein ACFSRY_18450 [Pontibacter locisalis]|uniref:Outer membrane protein beta-barrel domain-containing protein n=1 Tax=Pontibacter locisalis TaxID=1719035 RepID=A0ABW5IR41_9BACT